MGPQPFGCGRAPRAMARAWGAPASMGPQPFGCGRGRGRGGYQGRALASMGPQPFGCGRTARPCTRPPNLLLQWGRNLSVAEGKVFLRGTEGSLGLQWGRNLSVAEGKTIVKHDKQYRCASMGPQPFGCGRSSSFTELFEPALCFNGAATFRLRKDTGSYQGLRMILGFNGAATFRLRKGALAALGAVVE